MEKVGNFPESFDGLKIHICCSYATIRKQKV